MQIDELPAGEQTRHPDLDMNQVVGTHDILMLLLTRLILPSLQDFCLLRQNLIRCVAVTGCFSPCKRVQDVFRLKEVIHLQKRLLCRALPIQAMKRFV